MSTGSSNSVSSGGRRSSPMEVGGGSKPCSRTKEDSVFASVPSRSEIEKAILDLQRFMRSLSNSKSELSGVKGLLHDHQSKMQQAPGFVKFLDAFSMMQTEPGFKNSVTSICCDKAVWEAILSNKAVQDFRASVPAVKEGKLLTCSEEPDIAVLILKWITDFTKSKLLELVDKFLLLLNEILQPALKKKPTLDHTNPLDEKVSSSFLLSVVIILIVVTTRSQG